MKFHFSRRIVILSGVLFGIPVILYLSLALYVASFTHPPLSGTADAALVLGAKAYKGETYNPCLVSRVTTAATLIEHHTVKTILVSGGNDNEDQVNEAETMKKILLAHGVSAAVIFEEKAATSTYENFVFSKEIMRHTGIHSVVVVTEPFHIARARLIARSLGVNAQYIAAADSPCWTKWTYLSRYFLKEPFAILLYILTGKISLTAL